MALKKHFEPVYPSFTSAMESLDRDTSCLPAYRSTHLARYHPYPRVRRSLDFYQPVSCVSLCSITRLNAFSATRTSTGNELLEALTWHARLRCVVFFSLSRSSIHSLFRRKVMVTQAQIMMLRLCTLPLNRTDRSESVGGVALTSSHWSLYVHSASDRKHVSPMRRSLQGPGPCCPTHLPPYESGYLRLRLRTRISSSCTPSSLAHFYLL